MADNNSKPLPSDYTSRQGGADPILFMTTGTVKIRNSMKSQPIANRSVLMRRLRSFTDRSWSEAMPIGVFLVHHPDGPILFDTGESPHRNDPGFLPWWSPTHLLNIVSITRSDGIVDQLRERGIDPSSLQAIVLSHLHGDHAGGLHELAAAAPSVPVYVSKEHWEAFGNDAVRAKMNGCCPDHWPPGFQPKILDRTDDPIGPWKQSTKLTSDGEIIVVDTPGHVPGHVSLIARGEQDGQRLYYILVGDATYGIDLLDKEEPDGINDDPVTAMESLRLIKQFARETDVVVLPSHDPAVERLLRDRVVYKPKDRPARG